jgi:cobalt-zinc-cadmium efflux system outer membrane protein
MKVNALLPILALSAILNGCSASSGFKTPAAPHSGGGFESNPRTEATLLGLTHSEPSPASVAKEPVGAASLPPVPLSLSVAVDIAMRQHPDLRIAASLVEEAQGQLVQAGLYPNPTVSYEADDLNFPDAVAGKQGGMISQTLVTGGKLRLASAAAARGVEIADWKAQIRLFEVVTKIRTAFYEALAAQQQFLASQEIQRIAQDAHSTAEKLLKAGIVGQPDVLRAQVELEQSNISLQNVRERRTLSWRLLATALGKADLPEQELQGSLQDPVPAYAFKDVTAAVFEVSAEIQAAQAAIAQNEIALTRAEADVIPDLQVQFRPFYSFEDRRAEFAVGIGAPLPIWNRNQGNIMAARAAVAQARATLQQVQLQLTERLAQSFQRYQTAKQQVQAYEAKILPAAQESVRLILIAYGSGDARNDFTAVLEAQRSLAQARLGFVQARGDLQKAVAEIEGLLQRLPAGTATSSQETALPK